MYKWMDVWDIITDPLTRHYFYEEWYKGTKGIVEYVAEWVRDYSTTQDTKVIGILGIMTLAMIVAWKWKEIIPQPKPGENIWDVLIGRRKE